MHVRHMSADAGGKLMAQQSALCDGGVAPHDLDGFCKKIEAMVLMARDEPSFFDKVGECITTICQAACDHRVKMQAGFVSIALSVKVVEGSVLQVDPLSVVAPRAKAVILREHLRRKSGVGMLARQQEAEAERRLEEELAAEDARNRQDQQRRIDARRSRT